MLLFTIGKLIGKNLKDFEDLRNCEVNDFRWRMKVFANKIAQERKTNLYDRLLFCQEYAVKTDN